MKGQLPATMWRTTCNTSGAINWLIVGFWSVRSRAAAHSTFGGVVNAAISKSMMNLLCRLRELDNFKFLLLEYLGYLTQGTAEPEILFSRITERY